ncbi:MAG: F0F1 ATP synthase subunit epsilon [Xanthomonadales bacterium]|nr:F0F1 ATP synthase subunit epsilon [Xanthomonadales bacterium]
MSMRVRVILPSGVLLDCVAGKIIAEAPNGSFCLLPRHVDFVSALAPGILALTLEDGAETFLAVDEGTLVKRGAEVDVSAWNALEGGLGELQQALESQSREQDDEEYRARLALDRLEASLVHQVLELER